ncbi:MAG: DUF4160 domain-containing protein [Lachnospiraceae bacterium]|nr:DUF4160 domain-containing protein [Lachnospiraceae bacterium]MDD7664414.1 DUF4160 domain-containing protein [Lachnospiraceae bacterium]MDY4165794.1 DUF4160 domain-containing protein [Lachnospiraceae bacterium]
MPKCFSVYGYIVFFWSNENDPLEPIHVHIGKRIGTNCTKVWILSDGSTQIENNNSRIPERDLKKILAVIEAYSDYIISKWEFYFGEKAKFKDI